MVSFYEHKTAVLLYFICRDYLGSIIHIRNTSGGHVEQNSYDAWGRGDGWPGSQTSSIDATVFLSLFRFPVGSGARTGFGPNLARAAAKATEIADELQSNSNPYEPPVDEYRTDSITLDKAEWSPNWYMSEDGRIILTGPWQTANGWRIAIGDTIHLLPDWKIRK